MLTELSENLNCGSSFLRQTKLRTIHDDDNLQTFSAPLRLRGGGESSLSTGTSGWGSPPSQQGNNSNGKFWSNIIENCSKIGIETHLGL